jgi:hypothetical protein
VTVWKTKQLKKRHTVYAERKNPFGWESRLPWVHVGFQTSDLERPSGQTRRTLGEARVERHTQWRGALVAAGSV